MRRLVVASYLMLTTIFAVAALAYPNLSHALRRSVGAEIDDLNTLKFDAIHEMHQWQAAYLPHGTTVFLGNSLTMGLVTNLVASPSVNWGIGRLRTDHLLAYLRDNPALQRAARVFVEIGTNDLRQGRDAGIGERYAAILSEIPAAVPVVFTSVPPLPSLDAERVRQMHEAGRVACTADPRCTYIDLQQTLNDPGDQTDGVHLSPAGYAKWIAAMRSAVKG